MPTALAQRRGHPVGGDHQRRPDLLLAVAAGDPDPGDPAVGGAQRAGDPLPPTDLDGGGQPVGEHAAQVAVVGAEDLPVPPRQGAVVEGEQRAAVRVADGQLVDRARAGGPQGVEHAPAVEDAYRLGLEDLALRDRRGGALPVEHEHPQPACAERPGGGQATGAGPHHDDVGAHRATAPGATPARPAMARRYSPSARSATAWVITALG